MNKIFAGLVVLGMFLQGAQAQVNIIPGSTTLPGITQAAGDLRSPAQFQRDCAAGIQADTCGGKPAPKGCPAGTVWSTEGTGVAHCAVPVVVVPPEPPVVVPPAPQGPQLEATNRACPSGYTGTQTVNRYFYPDTGQYSEWTVTADHCTAVSAVPSCVASDIVTASSVCPAGMTGTLNTHTVNTCPGNVVSTYTSGCGSVPSFSPKDVNQDGVVDCTDVAIIKTSLNKRIGDPGFIARADINGDGVVNIADYAPVVRSLPAGTTCTPCPNSAVNYPSCSIMADGTPVARACLAPVNWCMTTRGQSGDPRDDLYEWGWTKYEGDRCLANSGSLGQRSGLEGGCPSDFPDGVPVWGEPSGYADGKP